MSGIFERLPNESGARYTDDGNSTPSPRAVAVRSVSVPRDEDPRDSGVLFVIETEGVRIVHGADLRQVGIRHLQSLKLGRVDVLILPVRGELAGDKAQALAAVHGLAPQLIVPIQFANPGQRGRRNAIDTLVNAFHELVVVERTDDNTLAVAAQTSEDVSDSQWVVLGDQPWNGPARLEVLWGRMDAACAASQVVFAPLTTRQMNFRPPNGSHTPRWNAEHMMGRQLLFFSQIFAAVDPTFRVVDLNPEQMPPDYRAAHPDWSGAEEARQMERSAAFVRRFAYLLDELPLDDRAPGSRWTLRGLLEQMERHFNEHTGNVKKKFDLPEWPSN